MSERLDETIPGGKYLSPDGKRFVDANGNDIGAVNEQANAEPDKADVKPAAKAAPKKDA
jgi:hypothetical protein